MISSPASSWARIASTVASFCASWSQGSETRHSSLARTRGGKRAASFWRSISHSGCGKLPTRVVGNSIRILVVEDGLQLGDESRIHGKELGDHLFQLFAGHGIQREFRFLRLRQEGLVLECLLQGLAQNLDPRLGRAGRQDERPGKRATVLGS